MANTTGKKFGARQNGTPNKLTSELRAVLKDLIHEELEILQERMDHLDPKERLEVLVKLLLYVLPKVSPASHTTDEPFEFGSIQIPPHSVTETTTKRAIPCFTSSLKLQGTKPIS